MFSAPALMEFKNSSRGPTEKKIAGFGFSSSLKHTMKMFITQLGRWIPFLVLKFMPTQSDLKNELSRNSMTNFSPSVNA